MDKELVTLLVLGLGAIGAMGFSVWQAQGLLRRAKRMEDTPTTPCGEVGQGLVEVKGRVSPLSEPLVSPMEQTPCVFYRFKVEEWVSRRNSGHWVVQVEETEGRKVLVEDETGAVQLDIGDAQLELNPTIHRQTGTFSEVPVELELLLQKHGLTSKGWFFNRSFRYEETVLRVGEPLYALGTARPGEDFPTLSRGEDGIFLVGDRPEEELTSTLRKRALGNVAAAAAGGAVLVALGLYGMM